MTSTVKRCVPLIILVNINVVMTPKLPINSIFFLSCLLQINCAVVPHEGLSIEESEVLQICKKNLASFKIPKRVFIVDSLPKTATGKIQRRVVAEHFLFQISAAKSPRSGA